MGMIELLLPLIIKLGIFFLDKSKASNEAKRSFIEFVEGIDKKYLNSVKLKNSIEAQKERLKKSQQES
jgi:hypothetical protein